MAFDDVPITSVRVTLSMHQRAKLMDGIAQEFVRRGNEFFDTIENLERDNLRVVRAMPTIRTVLEPVVEYLNAAGYPTEPTVGGVMDTLQITQGEVHDLACDCLGPKMKGHEVAKWVADLNDRIYSRHVNALAFADHLM